MTYIRKTYDDYSIYGLYNGEWEYICTAENYKDSRRLLKEYRKNDPTVAYKIMKRRMKK